MQVYLNFLACSFCHFLLLSVNSFSSSSFLTLCQGGRNWRAVSPGFCTAFSASCCKVPGLEGSRGSRKLSWGSGFNGETTIVSDYYTTFLPARKQFQHSSLNKWRAYYSFLFYTNCSNSGCFCFCFCCCCCCFLFFVFFTSNCQQERKHTTSIDWLWIFNYFSAPTTSDCRASPTTLPETCRRLPTTSDDLLPHLHHNGCWRDPCYYCLFTIVSLESSQQQYLSHHLPFVQPCF